MSNIAGTSLLNPSNAEESTVHVAGVTDETAGGDFFKIALGPLAAVQQRETPLAMSISRIKLVAYSGRDVNNRAKQTSSPNNVQENNLSIRTGRERHSWNDNYFAIEVIWQQKYSSSTGAITEIPTIIPMEEFNEPESYDDHLPVFDVNGVGQLGIYRASDTAFAFATGYSQNTYTFLKEIWGLRLGIS